MLSAIGRCMVLIILMMLTIFWCNLLTCFLIKLNFQCINYLLYAEIGFRNSWFLQLQACGGLSPLITERCFFHISIWSLAITSVESFAFILKRMVKLCAMMSQPKLFVLNLSLTSVGKSSLCTRDLLSGEFTFIFNSREPLQKI